MVVSTSVGKEASGWAVLLGWSQDRPRDVLVGGSGDLLLGGSGKEGTLPLSRSPADGP